MKRMLKIAISASFMTLSALLLSFDTLALGVNTPVNINEYDSIYRYSALERKVSFRDLVNKIRIKANKGREFYSLSKTIN